MSNKVSLVAIAGLSAVCLGLLWNQQNGAGQDVVSQSPALGLPDSKPVLEKTGRGTITVASEDQHMFVADEYITTFSIVQRNKDKGKAFSLMNANREKVMALFKKMNIDEKRVDQTSVDVKKDWTYEKNIRRDDGFVATQHFRVILSSKDDAETLEQELTQFSFVEESRIWSQLKNAEAMEVETIKSACKKVKQKADEYAQSVGANVGTAITVSGHSSVDQFNSTDSVGVFANVQASMRLVGKNESKNSYITVNQYENKKFLADKFIVSACIVIDGSNKELLYKQVAEKRGQIEDLAKNLGIAVSDVNTESLVISKKTKWELRGDGGKNPIAARQNVTVNFRSKDAAVTFFSALAGIEHVLPRSAEPALSNEDSLRIQVTNLAGQKALARAKALAEGFGGKIGDVVNVGDNAASGLQDYMAVNEVVMDAQPRLYKAKMGRSGGFNDGLAGLLGGGDGSMGMNIADSVEISSFISVVTELKY